MDWARTMFWSQIGQLQGSKIDELYRQSPLRNMNSAMRLPFVERCCNRLRHALRCEVPAIVLLSVLSVSPITPWSFAPDQGPELPACCLGDGAHGCSMAAAAAHTSSDLSINSAPCPSFPGVRAMPARAKIGLLETSQTTGAEIARRQSAKAPDIPGHRTVFSYSHPKRGPPPLPSC